MSLLGFGGGTFEHKEGMNQEALWERVSGR